MKESFVDRIPGPGDTGVMRQPGIDRVTRLVTLFTLLLVMLMLTGGWAFHSLLERGLRESSRRNLNSQAALIRNALEGHPAGPAAAWRALDPEALRLAAGLDRLELYTPDGAALDDDSLWGLASPDLPDSLAAELRLGLELMPPAQKVGDELFQTLYLPLFAPAAGDTVAAILRIESGEAVSARLQTLRRGLWWATGLAAAFVAFVLAAMAAILRQARRRQRELDRAEHLAQVGTLAAGLAHEIRNPLAIIAGNAELFELNATDGAGKRRADDIVEETERLQRLLEDFMNFARPMDLRLESVDLAALWRRALDEQAILNGDLKLELVAPDALPAIQADPDRLRQLALNLLANAAAAARSRVTVTLSRTGGGLRAAIADDGSGVPARIVARLFEPFASSREGGTGLGLAVSDSVARAHGGRLALAANGSDGAVFTLDLPLKENA